MAEATPPFFLTERTPAVSRKIPVEGRRTENRRQISGFPRVGREGRTEKGTGEKREAPGRNTYRERAGLEKTMRLRLEN